MQPGSFLPATGSRQVTVGQPVPQPPTTYSPVVGQVYSLGQQVAQQPMQPPGQFPTAVRASAQPFPTVMQYPPQLPQQMPAPTTRQFQVIQQQGGDQERMFPVAKKRL